MKNIVSLGLALLAAFTMTSCDKTPDPTPQPESKKLIKQIVVQLQDGEKPIVEENRTTYTYDDQKRLIEANSIDRGTTVVAKFTYEAGRIIIRTVAGNSAEIVTTNTVDGEGLITKSIDQNDTLNSTYADGRIKSSKSATHLLNFSWLNGNLATIEQTTAKDNQPISTQTFKYTDKVNNTNLKQYTSIYDLDWMIWSGFVGGNSLYLIDEIADSGSGSTKFSYQFDSDNSPVKITEHNIADNYKYIYTITY